MLNSVWLLRGYAGLCVMYGAQMIVAPDYIGNRLLVKPLDDSGRFLLRFASLMMIGYSTLVWAVAEKCDDAMVLLTGRISLVLECFNALHLVMNKESIT